MNPARPARPAFWTAPELQPLLAEVQGNILRGYTFPRCHYLVLAVKDAPAARHWLRTAASGGDGTIPMIRDGRPWDDADKPGWCLNIGITANGLRALGVAERAVRTLSPEFVEGVRQRATKIGDWGDSRPDNWGYGFEDDEHVHLVAIVSGERDQVDLGSAAVSGSTVGGVRPFTVLGNVDAEQFDGPMVHFGYRDAIAQPRFVGIHDPDDGPDDQPLTPVGAVLLGHESSFAGLTWRATSPAVLGGNGTYDALRVLEQDVQRFEDFLDDAADRMLAIDADLFGPREYARELVAAKMLGRWRNGSPLELWPRRPAPDGTDPSLDPAQREDQTAQFEASLNRFDYDHDEPGAKCPIGAHIRRANPRSAHIVQRNAAHVRRIVRRGMPYGPAYDPANRDDGVARGLVGNFLCSSLVAQFEAVMYDWVNLGLLDPRITGLNDPLIGQNQEEHSRFEFSYEGVQVVLRDLPRFVRTRGSAYLLLPSLPALRWIGELEG